MRQNITIHLSDMTAKFSYHNHSGGKAIDASHLKNDVTVINVIGIDGEAFEGYYIEDGNKVAVSETSPKTFNVTKLSKCEFHRNRQQQAITIERRDDTFQVVAASRPGTANIDIKFT